MSRYLSYILIVYLLAGCAGKSISVSQKNEGRSFEQENSYIIQALYYKEHKNYPKAYALFQTLYKKTGKPEYALEAARALALGKHYKEAALRLKELMAKGYETRDLYRLLVYTQLRLGDYEEARKAAQKLVVRDPDDLSGIDMLASLLLLKGKNEEAYKLYEKYYRKHHDPESVVKMATVLYHKFKKTQDAARLLESHRKMIGCDEKVCLFLAELYRQSGDFNRLADIYAAMYETTKSGEYAQKAAEIYAYLKQYDKAVKLLERSGADDRLLLALYKRIRRFKAGAKLAEKLYEQTMDPVWLAEYGILLYESAKNKHDPKMLESVTESLGNVIEKGVKDPLYYNYLGYILIDHDLDIKRGVELVRKALAVEPDSPFYIDSLAWGLYKLHRCGEAYKEMKKVVDKMGLKDPEIKKHWNAIKQCRSRKK